MLDKVGNKNFALLARMMDLQSANHKVISQNIANVNTPHYRRRVFKFDSALREAMKEGNATAYRNVEGWVDKPNVTPVRNNGNNVDIDLEMYMLNENSASYRTMGEIYRKKSAMVKSVIRGL